jgi:photosystem II stability/assembly factor-like uncharacterized protein
MVFYNIRKRSNFSIILVFLLFIINSSCNSVVNESATSISLLPSSIPITPSLISLNDEATKLIFTATPTMSSIINLPTLSLSNIPDIANWKRLGPDGGYTTIVAIDPVTHTTIYAASRSDLFTSIDGGAHWQQINSGLQQNNSIIALAIDPISPNTIYMIDRSSGSISAGKIYKTTNGGINWKTLKLEKVKIITINPINTNIIYAGCYDGLYKSDDGGDTWYPSTIEWRVEALVLDPINPDIIYAGIGDGSVYQSIDAGNTWTRIRDAIENNSTFIAIAIHPTQTNLIYVGTKDGIGRSTNGGKDWIQVVKWEEPNYDMLNGILAIIIDPFSQNNIYVGSRNGVYKSIDGGKHWKDINNGFSFPDIEYLELDQKEPNLLYAAVRYGGVYKTQDGGENWFPVNNGLSSYRPVVSIGIDPLTTSTIYASTYGLYKSIDSGRNWLFTSQYSLGGIIVIDPLHPSTIYLTGYEENLYKETWNDWGWGTVIKSLNGGGEWSSGNRIASGCGISSLVIDPKETNILYAGALEEEETSGVYKSMDGGITWERLSLHMPINTLAIDPRNTKILYAGMPLNEFRSQMGDLFMGNMYKSIDGGMNWEEIFNGIENHYEIPSIVIDPLDTSIIYIGEYKSVDAGKTWEKMEGGGMIILIDPLNSNILFAGGESGVLKSIDGGKTWFHIGLENNEIYSMTIDPINPTTIYVGTNNGVYVLEEK